jgi:hypothetical protein
MGHQELFDFAYNLYEAAIDDYSYHLSKSQMAATLIIMDTCTAVKFA